MTVNMEKLAALVAEMKELDQHKRDFMVGMADLNAQVPPTDDPRAVELRALKIQAGEALLAAVELEIQITQDAIAAEMNK